MKINHVPRSGSLNPYRSQQDSKADYASGKKGNLKDQVQISSEAKELLGAHNITDSKQRIEKVQQLKDSVSSGTYHVEANKIAEKLLPFFK